MSTESVLNACSVITENKLINTGRRVLIIIVLIKNETFTTWRVQIFNRQKFKALKFVTFVILHKKHWA